MEVIAQLWLVCLSGRNVFTAFFDAVLFNFEDFLKQNRILIFKFSKTVQFSNPITLSSRIEMRPEIFINSPQTSFPTLHFTSQFELK